MRYAFAANLATLGIITLPVQTGSSLSFDGNGIWIGDLSMLSMTSGELETNLGKLLFTCHILCRLPQIQTNRYGLNSLSHLEVVSYETLKDYINRAGTLTKLKNMMAKWDGKACHCLICK